MLQTGGAPHSSSWDETQLPELPAENDSNRSDGIVNDSTCHGVLGWTLRQALDELVVVAQSPQQHQSQQDQQHDGSGDSDSASASTTASATENTQNEEEYGDEDDFDQRNTLTRHQLLRPEMIPPILTSLGLAIAETQRHRQQLQQQHQQQQQSSSSIAAASTTTTPQSTHSLCCGLLRGRIAYYCRRGTKWRLVIEDAQLQPRNHRMHPHLRLLASPLQQQQDHPPGQAGRRGRRRRSRKSLWSRAMHEKNSAHTAHDGCISLKTPLEILAYNDNG